MLNPYLLTEFFKGILFIPFFVIKLLTYDKLQLKNREQLLLNLIQPFDDIGFNVSKSAFRPLNCPLSDSGRQRIKDRHRGENSEVSKLTEKNVIDIKERLANGELLRCLSKEFGVSTTVISNVKRGKTWSHVTVSKEIQNSLDRRINKNKHKYGHELIKNIKIDLKNGIRMIDISIKYNVPYMTVNSIKTGANHSKITID